MTPHTCPKADRKCRDCVACDDHRRTHRISPPSALPYGVVRCSNCDGQAAHTTVRTEWAA